MTMRVFSMALGIALLSGASVVWAQESAVVSHTAYTTYRIFLASGEPLPSYGEPVLVGDRVIFNLLVGDTGGSPDVQLVSLPSSGIDLDRTERYSHAMRATHYAATRGEADYAAMTAEVARVLDQLTAVTDVKRRLALAEGARAQLLSWSEAHYQYRSDDIRELALLFEDVIAELRRGAGEAGVSIELFARPAPLEALLPAPTSAEALALALSAARTADIGAERVGILERAAAAAGRQGAEDVERTITQVLAEEVKAGSAYGALMAALQARADAARRRGDVAAVERLAAELVRRDRQLGQRRPAEVREFNARLTSTLEATRSFRAALDAYTRQLASMRRYDGRVRPLLARFERLEAPLTTLREMRGITPSQLGIADAELLRLTQELATVNPPAAQAAVHASLQNVLEIAREAFARRRLARSSQSAEMREASAAASGALLLGGQVRRDLAASLRRPTIQ